MNGLLHNIIEILVIQVAHPQVNKSINERYITFINVHTISKIGPNLSEEDLVFLRRNSIGSTGIKKEDFDD